MSDAAKAWAWKQAVKPPVKAVLMALADEADDAGTCFPALKRIAGKSGLSRPTVIRHLRTLETAPLRLVLMEPRTALGGRQTSNLYRLQLDRYATEQGVRIGHLVILELPLELQDVVGEGLKMIPPPSQIEGGGGSQNDTPGGLKMIPPSSIDSSLTGSLPKNDKKDSLSRKRDGGRGLVVARSASESIMPITEGILAELNRLTRMCFKSQHPNGELTANGRLVLALLKKGYQADQLTRVVRLKCRAWLGGDMQKFLRPKTLFAPANFDQYVAGLAEPPAVQTSGHTDKAV